MDIDLDSKNEMAILLKDLFGFMSKKNEVKFSNERRHA